MAGRVAAARRLERRPGRRGARGNAARMVVPGGCQRGETNGKERERERHLDHAAAHPACPQQTAHRCPRPRLSPRPARGQPLCGCSCAACAHRATTRHGRAHSPGLDTAPAQLNDKGAMRHAPPAPARGRQASAS